MACLFGWKGVAVREPRSTRVTWGVFDGVHVGHRVVIDEAAAWARRDRCESIVLTFDPHPQAFLRSVTLPLIVPVAERARRIVELGIDTVIVVPFDRAFAEIVAESFVADVLLGRLGAGGIVIGYDSTFGKGRTGTPERLRALAAKRGVEVRTPPPLGIGGRAVKSSLLREAVARGDLDGARAMMGRPVSLTGPVVRGAGRGRSLGVPTANVDCSGIILPPAGVYAVRGGVVGPPSPVPRPPSPVSCRGRDDGGQGTGDRGPGTLDLGPSTLDSRPLLGVMNIGRRPTFGGDAAPSVEVHFFDLQVPDLYGATVRVEVVARLREEKTFPDAAALRAQIAADCAAAGRILET